MKDGREIKPKIWEAEDVAKLFHETYERLAPAFGYKTRKDTAVKWDELPARNKNLMIATCRTVLNTLGS